MCTCAASQSTTATTASRTPHDSRRNAWTNTAETPTRIVRAHRIKSGSRDILVEDLDCTHSHGITIGSIWYDDVTNVTYRNCRCEHQGPLADELPRWAPWPKQPGRLLTTFLAGPRRSRRSHAWCCRLHELSAGPRIKGRRQGNATISDIHFENILLDGVRTGIQVDMT